MYECPNCGGNLRFDIASQQLACAFCNAQFDPYAVSGEKGAEEDNSYDVTVFTCPQCAGEIYSTDNTAAGFCSFCGASTILNSRIEKEKRPGYIIPFKKTKADCKQAYTKMMKRAIFAPKELKDEKHIDSFRGIYMPYWVYHISQKGPIQLKGKTEERDGDYIVIKKYNLNADLNFDYKGMVYDASSSFADNISQRIAPFDVKNMKEFTPSILSGFYADTADVESAVYEEVAVGDAKDRTANYIRNAEMSLYEIEESDSEIERKLNTQFESKDSAMFPVWFLAYRNKERVAYATVNGQTGKVVADLPVDIKKYLLGSLVLALPLFFLLDLFFTVRPTVLLPIVCILSMVSVILHAVEMKEIAAKEQYADDIGAREALKKKREKEWLAGEAAVTTETVVKKGYMQKREEKEKEREEILEGRKKKQKIKKAAKVQSIIWVMIVLYIIFNLFITLESSRMSVSLGWISHIPILAALVAAFIAGGKSFSYASQISARKGICGALWVMLAMLAATAVDIWQPVEDYYYYGAALLSLVAMFFTLLDLILCYNILATRRLPQFDYQGGDDRA